VEAEGLSGTKIRELMHELGRKAKDTARVLALAPDKVKNAALAFAATELRTRRPAIIAANERDLAAARARGISAPLLDRLMLDETRVDAMARALNDIIALPDPIGVVTAQWERPNGLHIQRVAVPLGVIGMIYESRPNVTADAGALCLKSGNAAILRADLLREKKESGQSTARQDRSVAAHGGHDERP